MAFDSGSLQTAVPDSPPAPAVAAAWPFLPDDLAYATWLKWGLLGEERALALLQADLMRLGVIGRDLTLTPAAQDVASPFECAAAGWSPLSTALVAAGVWLLAERRATAHREVLAPWARRVLARARAWAAANPGAMADPGVPMALACEMVQAQALLLEPHGRVTDMRAGVLLGSILGHACFATMPLPWRQAAWRTAEALHRRAGRAEPAREYRQLLARHGRDAEAVIALASLRGLARVAT